MSRWQAQGAPPAARAPAKPWWPTTSPGADRPRWGAEELGPALVLMGAILGAATRLGPAMAIGALGGAVLLALPFIFPVAHLTLLIGVTNLVPFELQNTFSFGAGRGSPGLIVADVLLLGGLARAVVVLAVTRLARVPMTAIIMTALLVAVAAMQFLAGLGRGADPSVAGDEMRKLLGFAALIVACPIVLNTRQRRRLLASLLGLGFLLGLWGLAQWLLQIPYVEGGDVGVRQGVAGTSAGRGQLQGGLYAYPVAIIFGFAFLVLGQPRSRALRAALVLLVAVNAACLTLTFERTFWANAILGSLFVLARATGAQRTRAILMAPWVALIVALPIALAFPETLMTAQQRLFSVRGAQSDPAVTERVVESKAVLERVKAEPLLGSGLGATVYWGRPADLVPPKVETFAHNGYLWVSWKIGIPAALLLFAGIVLAIARRSVGLGDAQTRAACVAAQGSLLGLFVGSVTFPAYASRAITPVMGFLLALCALPTLRRARSSAGHLLPVGPGRPASGGSPFFEARRSRPPRGHEPQPPRASA